MERLSGGGAVNMVNNHYTLYKILKEVLEIRK